MSVKIMLVDQVERRAKKVKRILEKKFDVVVISVANLGEAAKMFRLGPYALVISRQSFNCFDDGGHWLKTISKAGQPIMIVYDDYFVNLPDYCISLNDYKRCNQDLLDKVSAVIKSPS